MKRIFFGLFSNKLKLLLRVASIGWWLIIVSAGYSEVQSEMDNGETITNNVLDFLIDDGVMLFAFIPIAISFVLSFFVDSITHFLPYIISLFILTPIVSWQTSYNEQDYMKSLDYHVSDGWKYNFSFFYTLLIVVFAYSIINYKALTKK